MITDDPSEEVTFLSLLDPAVREELCALGNARRYPPGALLLHEGQANAPVMILREGRVKVTTLASSGRELMLAVEGAGAVIGELAALDAGPCSATVTALDRVDAILLLPGAFRGFLQERPDTAMLLLSLLGARVRDGDRKRVEFGALDTVGRVAARLVELAQRFGEPEPDGAVRITVALSQEELAGWIGSSREATVKALGQLRGLGWVQTGRRHLLVQDLEALRRRAAA